eukprot:5306300-Ditylum_brightwellii.AAC.1
MDGKECGMYAWIEHTALHGLNRIVGSSKQKCFFTTGSGRGVRISRKPKVAQVLGYGGIGLVLGDTNERPVSIEGDNRDICPPYLIIHDGKTYAT